MRRKPWLIFNLALLLALVVPVANYPEDSALAQETSAPSRSGNPGTPGPEVRRQDHNPNRIDRLSSALNDLVEAQRLGTLASDARRWGIALDDNRVHVTIEMSAVEAAPVTLRSAVELGRLGPYVSYTIPVEDLPLLASGPGVRWVDLPMRASPAVIGEGVNLIGATTWQNSGFTGASVKIGIIDTFQGYTAKLGSELPVSINTSCTQLQLESGNNHGTRIAEIIHDIAPGAELFLVNALNDPTQAQSAVQCLANNGVSIVNFSAGYPYHPYGGPGDGTGAANMLVDFAASMGILWVNAVGNHAQKHWSGPWNDPDSDGFLNYSGVDQTQDIQASIGEIVDISVRWNDVWGGSCQDYDLLVFDDLITGILGSGGQNPQTCAPEHRPVEHVSFVAPYSGTFKIVIRRVNASGTHQFDLLSWNHETQYQTAARSIVHPADSTNPGMVSVGAVSAANPTVIEPFSSQGPTTDGRIKPDLVGPNQVLNSSGSTLGTSFAAPHVAGAAALVKQANPSFTASQIRTYLTGRAIDLGPAGPDNQFGSGRLNLGIPPAASTATWTTTLTPSRTPTLIPAATSTSTPTRTPTRTNTPLPTPTFTLSPTTASTFAPTATRTPTASLTLGAPSPTTTPVAPGACGSFSGSGGLSVNSTAAEYGGISHQAAPPVLGQNGRTLRDVTRQSDPEDSAPNVAAGGGWTTVACETFEGAWPTGNWYTGDNNGATGGNICWGTDEFQPYPPGGRSAWPAKGCANGVDPSVSLYPPNVDSWMIYGPFSLVGSTAAEARFRLWHQIAGDFGPNGPIGDNVGVYAYTPSSEVWGYSRVGSTTFVQPPTSSGWIEYAFDLARVPTLGSLLGQPSVYVAWIFESDADGTDDGPFVDDVFIRKTNGATPTPTATRTPTITPGGPNTTTPTRTPTLFGLTSTPTPQPGACGSYTSGFAVQDGAVTNLRDSLVAAPMRSREPNAMPSKSIRDLTGPQAETVHSTVAGETTILCETFEGAWPRGNWDTLDFDFFQDGEYCWGSVPFQGFQSSRSAWPAAGCANALNPAISPYPPSTYPWLIYGPFSLVGATSAEVRFRLWRQINGQLVNGQTQGDSLFVAPALPTTAFADFWGYAFTGQGTAASEPPTASGWQDVTINLATISPLGSFLGQPEVYLYWQFYSDASGTDNGPFIDDVWIHAVFGGGATNTPTVTAIPSSTRTSTIGPPTATRTSIPSPTSTPSFTPTRSITPTSTRTPTATRAPTATVLPAIAGRDFSVGPGPIGSALATWTSGTSQTGVIVIRWSPQEGVRFSPADLVPYPANTVSFVDFATPVDEVYCYLAMAVGGFPSTINNFLGFSDFLCIYSGGAAGNAPRSVSVELNQSLFATLKWVQPISGGQTSYRLTSNTFNGAPDQVIPLGSGDSIFIHYTGGNTTCYKLEALTNNVVTGTARKVCAVPGIYATVAGGVDLQTALDTLSTVVEELRFIE